MDFILDLVRGPWYGSNASFFVALPIYIMAYAGAVWAGGQSGKGD